MVFPVVPDSSNYRVWFFIGVSPSWPDHFHVMPDLIGDLLYTVILQKLRIKSTLLHFHKRIF